MPFIKKLVFHGFKSFPKRTEILLDRTMNVVVGPNGSGKSNITDAICFVLGRLSIKSMRAAKAAHLIFTGSKLSKPASEASVEIVFDNSDKIFSMEEKEISIKRIVRNTGQSIYKINNSVKTRQEILELLAQSGVDPHGFNIVLQGEIQSFVKMHGEERRKVIEEVAGISVYETRKHKSLKELERTDNKLKEVSAVLKERTAYLKNLEAERQQALRFKKLELTVKKCKASILKRKIDDKQKEKSKLTDETHKKSSALDKINIAAGKLQDEIKSSNNKIEEINTKVQKSSGLEQHALQNQVAELKAEIAGLSVRKDNYQNQISEIERRKQELQKNIEDSEQEIKQMRKTKGKSRKQDFEAKKTRLEELEEKRKKLYAFKSSLNSITLRLDDKNKEFARLKEESNFTLKKLEELESSLSFKATQEEHKKKISALKSKLEENKNTQKQTETKILELERMIAASQSQTTELEKIKKQVAKLDICPLCKTKITPQHIHQIKGESNKKIFSLKRKIEESETEKNTLWEEKESRVLKIKKLQEELEKREKDLVKLEGLEDKKQHLKQIEQNKQTVHAEIQEVSKNKKQTEASLTQFKSLEQEYDSLKLEVEELSRHEEVDVGMEITLKQRELDRMKLIIKQISREKQELEEEVEDISSNLEEREQEVEEKSEKEQALQRKYKKMFEEKNKIQDKIRLFESSLLKKQNESRLVESEINNLKIKLAEINAQIEGLEAEYKEFHRVELIKATLEVLQEKLTKTQDILSRIGSVNLRALEVYDEIKKEYDAIAEKVEQLQKEKQEVLKIIEEIDKKKKRAFIKTLKEINSLFSRNFSQLCTKGDATLEIENKEDIFAGGLDIIIRMGRGKYFNVTSLSGGEQTLIALSLIFAIQEYRPYCFYIFDEIDAALDKRNSERLAMLLKKHMKAGQYLIVTHNDALISEATKVYGVSMQDGISKILSLEV